MISFILIGGCKGSSDHSSHSKSTVKLEPNFSDFIPDTQKNFKQTLFLKASNSKGLLAQTPSEKQYTVAIKPSNPLVSCSPKS